MGLNVDQNIDFSGMQWKLLHTKKSAVYRGMSFYYNSGEQLESRRAWGEWDSRFLDLNNYIQIMVGIANDNI